ncbi:MAG: dipicolinate synthase subunit DpsA [Clostridiaceae bacterium]|nr:dipicolinate synthase subunit DpsA [Clostridiaceae bacterium]
MDRKKYAVIGGDMRNIYLTELLKKDYQYVEIYGFDRSGRSWTTKNPPVDCVLKGAQIIIGGIPFLSGTEYVNTPYSDEKLKFSEVLSYIPENSLLIAGKIPHEVISKLKEKKVKCIDILEREEMAVLNAVPTAEGAIFILLQELPKTLMDSTILILGYGRISKILSKMLNGFGVEVWVAARKYSDLAWIEAQGFKPVPFSQIDRYVGDMDAVVNTVPALVITKDILQKARKDCFLLDLASVPGGIDFDAAKALNFKYNWALGLPGKVAPLTAGDIIRKTVYNIVEEERGAY